MSARHAATRTRRTLALVLPVCDWFALCANEAAMTRSHPILGEVNICQRCNDKVEAIGSATVRPL